MTFDYDLLNWLFGFPDEVCAAGSTMADGSLGHVSAMLRYPDFIATVEASGFMPVGFPFTVGLRVVGEDQAIELTAKFLGDIPDVSFMSHAAETTDGSNRYEAECRYFVECVRGTADSELLSAERALEALRLSVATQRSIREGRTIKLAEILFAEDPRLEIQHP